MSNQILLRFLSAGLINVGGDDAKFDRLKETASDLASALKKTPAKATAFALIAFDPEAPADDPVIREVVEALQKRWPTYVNTFSGTPVAVIRAMLLDALVQAADDDKVGVAFVTSARNVLPFMEAGNEREIWAEVVAKIERRVDARAEAEWAVPEAISVPAMTFAMPEAITISTLEPSIDKANLAKKFEAAAGPLNAAGRSTNGNPTWPQNDPQRWATEFGKHMADAVVEALGVVIEGLQIEPVDLSAPLKGFAQAVATHVDGTLKAVSSATAGLQRRTNLIWWKETLYSPSARRSYRGMSTVTAASLMAFDLHQLVPTFSPASVAAFLHEAVLSLPTLDPAVERPIRDLLTAAVDSPELAPFRVAAARLFQDLPGRGPILKLLRHGSGLSTLDNDTFRAQVGVPAATPLTGPHWATWLFRELQAARATEEGTESKKRGRKS